jgi:hypothetical protein
MQAVLIHRGTNSSYLVAQSGELFFLIESSSRFLPDLQVGDWLEFEVPGFARSIVHDLISGKSFEASYIFLYSDKFSALTAAFELGWQQEHSARKSARSAA